MFVIVLLFAPLLRCFWLNQYSRMFLVTTPSAEKTEGYTDTLLSFQTVLISRAEYSYFEISSASVLGRLWVKGTAVCVLSVDGHRIGAVEMYRFVFYYHHHHYYCYYYYYYHHHHYCYYYHHHHHYYHCYC